MKYEYIVKELISNHVTTMVSDNLYKIGDTFSKNDIPYIVEEIIVDNEIPEPSWGSPEDNPQY